MSPRSIVALIVWVICLGSLFVGLFAWGYYVQQRDEQRKDSTALTLQRGDLPVEYRIQPAAGSSQLLLDSLAQSTGAQAFLQTDILLSNHQPFQAQVYYLKYATPAQARTALLQWRELLVLPKSGYEEKRVHDTGRGRAAALWSQEHIVMLVLGTGAKEKTVPTMQAIVQAVDARASRWVQAQPAGDDPFKP